MKKDIITIIVPIYKVEKYLKKCIESVIHQTYQNIQIILVEDGSPDNCGKICDEYAEIDKRIEVIHKKNGGLSDARNKGLEITKGKYVFFLDSDDFIEKNTIQYLYELSQKYEADIVVGNLQEIYENENIREKEEKQELIRIYDKEQALEKMLYNTEFTNMGCNKLYKIDLFSEIRYPIGKLYEDLGTTYKLIANIKNVLVTSSNITYYYLINRNDSIMNNQFNKKRMDAIEFTEEILEFVQTNYPSITKAAIARLYMECIFILLKLPNKKEFLEYNQKIKKYLRKYRKMILMDKKIIFKQKMLCFITIFGRIPLRFIWNLKEKIKRGDH